MLQFGGGGVFEAKHLAALRVDPRHHVPDDTVLSRRIHRLKDQQNGITIGRVMKLLHRAQSRNMLSQQFLIVLFRRVHRLDKGRPFLEVDLVSFPDAEIG